MKLRWRAGGCTFAPDAAEPADRAHILWSASLDPTVLAVVAERARCADAAFDLSSFGDAAAIVPAVDREHVVIRVAGGLLRFDIESGTVQSGPVVLAHRLTGRGDLDSKLPELRQLVVLCELGPAAPWIIPPDPRLDRLILALRALDARREGVSLREIGLALVGRAAEWPGEGESTKSWVRRLVALSDALWQAGPRGVLARAV